jgi:hypothetical protein
MILAEQWYSSNDLMGLFLFEETIMEDLIPALAKKNREPKTLYYIGSTIHSLKIEIHGDENNNITETCLN